MINSDGRSDAEPASEDAFRGTHGRNELCLGEHRGKLALSDSNLTLDAAERLAYESFLRDTAAPEHGGWFGRLYRRWAEYNTDFFRGAMVPPHLGIGRVSPRQFVECRPVTDYGRRAYVVFADRVMFATDTRLVREGYPAEGLLRFADDLLLHATVKQYVTEVRGTDEAGWGGFGPLFVAEANRIGDRLGLPAVQSRRRGFRGTARPVAASWPWALRPDGYYLGHVRLGRLKVAGLRPRPVTGPAVPGFCEYLLYLAVTGQTARQIEVLGRAVDRTTETRVPAVRGAERRPLDPSGLPLPVPDIDPGWLAWNGGCVRAMAEGIRHRRAFDIMPILADALQDAGCENPVLLDHLRADTDHTANCWALRLLTGERPD